MRYQTDHFINAGGETIFTQQWFPEEIPLAIILLVHGVAEHSSRYREMAEHFTHRQYAVCTLDLPGHGQSTGKRGHINSFQAFVETVAQYRQQLGNNYPDLPILILGHSLGGLITLHCLLQHPDDFRGAILSAPALISELQPPKWQLALLGFLSKHLPTLGTIKFNAEGVNREYEEQGNNNDSLIYWGRYSARMISQSVSAMATAQEQLHNIQIPILLLHSTDDKVTSVHGSELIFNQISSTEKVLKTYPNLYHEILFETERETIYQDIFEWLQHIIPTTQNDN